MTTRMISLKTTPNYIVFRELFKWPEEIDKIATYDEYDYDPSETTIIATQEFEDWCRSQGIRYDLQFKSCSVFYLRFFRAKDATKFIEKYKAAA